MKTVIESLEIEIPLGEHCHGFTNSGKKYWCRYHEMQPPRFGEDGYILFAFCHLHEEHIGFRKICGINLPIAE